MRRYALLRLECLYGEGVSGEIGALEKRVGASAVDIQGAAHPVIERCESSVASGVHAGRFDVSRADTKSVGAIHVADENTNSRRNPVCVSYKIAGFPGRRSGGDIRCAGVDFNWVMPVLMFGGVCIERPEPHSHRRRECQCHHCVARYSTSQHE